MKALLTFIPGIVRAVTTLWGKTSEWSAKKKIAAFVIGAVALIAFTYVVGLVGTETATFAAQLLLDTLTAFVEVM